MDEYRSYDRRTFLRTVGASAAALGLAPLLAPARAGAAAPPPDGGPADLPPRTVGLRTLGGDFRFDPVGVEIAPGETIRWLNMGDFHTATAFHPDNADLLAVDVPRRIPEGARSWHSGMLGMSGGTQFEHTFRVAGVHDYFCQPHYSFGMVGRVVVRPPGGAIPDAAPLSELNEASREQMPSVEAVTGPVGRTFEWAARLNGLLYLRANDGDAAGAAAALQARLGDDGDLRGLLSRTGEEGDFRGRLSRVVAGAREGVGYQELLGRVDGAKDLLATARSVSA